MEHIMVCEQTPQEGHSELVAGMIGIARRKLAG